MGVVAVSFLGRKISVSYQNRSIEREIGTLKRYSQLLMGSLFIPDSRQYELIVLT